MGKIRKTHTKEEKIKAVQLYLEGELSYRDVASQLNISSTKSIRKWVAYYQAEGVEGLEEKRGKSVSSRTGRPRKRELSLEEEVLRLRAENEYLKKWLGLERS